MGNPAGRSENPSEYGHGRIPSPTGLVQYERNGVWIVVAYGAYDLDSVSPLAEALETAARKYSRVVMDASGLTFADSTVLNLLLRVHQATELRVAGPAPQLQRLLELTGADEVVDVRATVEEAVA
ncbi:STAS domain-containing protein [Streptomyces sp. NPDC046727]|uniref:STAS domain-containing protein n=1 Tax=Streptomyces sp. NPDC046727 TaxID=3155373 RepID=UPI0033F6199A